MLAEFYRNGRIRPTALFQDLYAEAVALRPSAVVIDTVSDVFLGDEIKRDQVRQFGSLMRKLAIDANTAAISRSQPAKLTRGMAMRPSRTTAAASFTFSRTSLGRSVTGSPCDGAMASGCRRKTQATTPRPPPPSRWTSCFCNYCGN